MLSIKELLNIMSKKYPNRKVNTISIYKNGYLVFAGDKRVERDYNNPIFIIKEDGTISGFNPLNDLEGFKRSRSNSIIYEDRG